MRFILIISLIVLLINVAKPDYIKANDFIVNQCSIDMIGNSELMCD